MEAGLERYDWGTSLPAWFNTPHQDLVCITRHHGFISFSHRTRFALIIVVFFKKFHKNSADRAWRNFKNAYQLSNESLENWSIRLDKYEIKAARCGVQISFKDYLHQWSTGTSPGYFLTALRKAKNMTTH